MKKAAVIIFGSSDVQESCDCDEAIVAAGCDGCKSNVDFMKKEAEHLRKLLEKKYGDTLNFNPTPGIGAWCISARRRHE
jgi:hypothetical protein